MHQPLDPTTLLKSYIQPEAQTAAEMSRLIIRESNQLFIGPHSTPLKNIHQNPIVTFGII